MDKTTPQNKKTYDKYYKLSKNNQMTVFWFFFDWEDIADWDTILEAEN